MAPLDMSRHARRAGRTRRDDLTNVLPLKRRVRIDFRRTARSSISNVRDSDSIFEESNQNYRSLNYRQISPPLAEAAIDDGLKEIEDARPEQGTVGQFVGNTISLPERKSTTSLEDPSTTSTDSTTSTVIAISISTTDAASTTSTTSTVLTIPPPTAVAQLTSTSIDAPASTLTTTATPDLPPSPSTVAANPTTSNLPPSPDVPTAVTSFLSPTASIGVIIPLLPSPPNTTSQSRDEISPNAVPTFITSNTPIDITMLSSAAPRETVIGSTTTAQVNSGDNSQLSNNNNSTLSPTVAHVLIAAGVIGGFIIVVASIYILTRMKYIDIFSKLRDREIRRGENGWFGWYKKKSSSAPDLPPDYPWDMSAYPADHKPMAQRSHSGTHLSPLVISKAAIPQTVTTPLLAETRTQYTFYEVPIERAGPPGASQPMASRQATQSSRQDAYTFPSTHNINNTYKTDLGSLAQNVSSSFDPARNQQNRASQLSSLSSGFGDGQIIIPESPPKLLATGTPQENNKQTHGFSWVTSIFQAKQAGDRDTVYTSGSEESTKRYRTVNSWVAQQTRHIEGGQEIGRETPNIPEIPVPIQSNRDTDEGSAGNLRSLQN